MDELMDKNLAYFVGGNLATLAAVSAWTSTVMMAMQRDGQWLLLIIARYLSRHTGPTVTRKYVAVILSCDSIGARLDENDASELNREATEIAASIRRQRYFPREVVSTGETEKQRFRVDSAELIPFDRALLHHSVKSCENCKSSVY